MRSRDRRIMWVFLAGFAAAAVLQGIGVKLAARLIKGTLPLPGALGFLGIVAVYGLALAMLTRLLWPGGSKRDTAVTDGESGWR